MTTTVLSTISKAPAATTTPIAEPASEATAEASSSTATSSPETPAVVSETPEIPNGKVAPDPDLEIAKKFDQVARREAKSRKHETELQSLRTSLSAKEKELEATIAEYKAALEDPIDHYLKKGKDPVEVAKRFARPVSEEEKRLAKIEERLQKDEDEREKLRQENETREQTRQRHAVMSRFVQAITPEEYPHLTAVYDANEVPGLIHDLLNSPQDPTDPESPTLMQAFKARHGRPPTDKEIRDALEHKAELRAMGIVERLPKRQPASQVTPETPPANEGSTSLSNQHASSSPSSLKRTKSREEVMKELKTELEAEGGE